MIEKRDGTVYHNGRFVGKIEFNACRGRWQFLEDYYRLLVAESGTHAGLYREIERRYVKHEPSASKGDSLSV